MSEHYEVDDLRAEVIEAMQGLRHDIDVMQSTLDPDDELCQIVHRGMDAVESALNRYAAHVRSHLTPTPTPPREGKETTT